MNIPATKEEILENFKKNNNGRPLNKDDYEIAEALSRITYKAYEVGMEDAKQLYMEDMMDNKRCNALHVFKSKSFGQLRTIEENGKILFCASDVAKALGYSNPRDAISRHCRGVVKRDAPTQGGVQAIAFIPEGDVYRLITHSKLPGDRVAYLTACEDVLPHLYCADRVTCGFCVSGFALVGEGGVQCYGRALRPGLQPQVKHRIFRRAGNVGGRLVSAGHRTDRQNRRCTGFAGLAI